ncbi:putative transcription factor B3-Domain family [Helianthus annuus]|uniref:Transcription factor B3-Domain family n=1 Tax=Helianthus annuus TaxID=4232 RepID=A0A9K3MXJ4_HELAN|nr:putative transcription factor B3-Domain family [Helianthus annuus]KAJ0490309.1 putative transcription factor B3-Domain family [Helianthus annuus]KAJ0494473.1 putative transcription factor B3-Domain family [Helianthus annuus]KAJ0506228.1 putative transcription factor B3-Domain family [Helianthus annuus]KAJ0675900.1 putative transcription factor B3-Domain family [Helianthus annuus]
MYCSFVKFLHNPGSLTIDVPMSFVKQVYGETWEDKKLHIFHASGKKWVVRLKRVNSVPVITDGWQTVASDLKLQNDCLLTFHPLAQFVLDLSCFVKGVCGESYYTINRYQRLGVTIIGDAFVEECYGNKPPTGTYEICYKGSMWSVSTSKLHTSYVFSQGWPEVCNDLGIQEDDLLIFRRMDDVLFDLTVYRNEIEIRLTKIGESHKDDVFQISKDEYYDKVFKDIEEDDKFYIPDEDPSFSKVVN